jgi:hypothetical protein
MSSVRRASLSSAVAREPPNGTPRCSIKASSRGPRIRAKREPGLPPCPGALQKRQGQCAASCKVPTVEHSMPWTHSEASFFSLAGYLSPIVLRQDHKRLRRRMLEPLFPPLGRERRRPAAGAPYGTTSADPGKNRRIAKASGGRPLRHRLLPKCYVTHLSASIRFEVSFCHKSAAERSSSFIAASRGGQRAHIAQMSRAPSALALDGFLKPNGGQLFPCQGSGLVQWCRWLHASAATPVVDIFVIVRRGGSERPLTRSGCWLSASEEGQDQEHRAEQPSRAILGRRRVEG